MRIACECGAVELNVKGLPFAQLCCHVAIRSQSIPRRIAAFQEPSESVWRFLRADAVMNELPNKCFELTRSKQRAAEKLGSASEVHPCQANSR